MRVGTFLPTYSCVKGMWHAAPGKGNGGGCGSGVAGPALLARLMVRGPLWYSSMSGSVELTGSEAGVVAGPRVERRLHILAPATGADRMASL